jgi:hypothetical protein
VTRNEYDQWADRHGTMFGFRAFESDFAMLDSWYAAFRVSGYGVADLDAATAALAQRPPRHRADHLAAIHAAARERRAKLALDELRRAQSSPDPAEIGVCDLCGDTGSVCVPHPRFVVGGEWVPTFLGYRPLAAVVCACWVGRRMIDSYDEKSAEYQKRVPRPMTLEQYQRCAMPHWRQVLASDESARRALHVADAATAAADRTAGPLAGVVRNVVAGATAG